MLRDEEPREEKRAARDAGEEDVRAVKGHDLRKNIKDKSVDGLGVFDTVGAVET
jgi:hypothetical protein